MRGWWAVLSVSLNELFLLPRVTSSIAAVTQRIARRVFRQVMIADALAGRSDYFAPMWGETAVEAKSVSDWGFLWFKNIMAPVWQDALEKMLPGWKSLTGPERHMPANTGDFLFMIRVCPVWIHWVCWGNARLKSALAANQSFQLSLHNLWDFAVKNELMERAERVSERVPQKHKYCTSCTSLLAHLFRYWRPNCRIMNLRKGSSTKLWFQICCEKKQPTWVSWSKLTWACFSDGLVFTHKLQ